MKSLELKSFGVIEMNSEEVRATDGGIIVYLYFLAGKAAYGAGMAVIAAGLKAAYDTGYDSIK